VSCKSCGISWGTTGLLVQATVDLRPAQNLALRTVDQGQSGVLPLGMAKRIWCWQCVAIRPRASHRRLPERVRSLKSLPNRRFLRVMLLLAATVTMSVLSAPVSQAQAKNVYLAQSAAGAGNGADCADAYAYIFFNAAANWGTGATQIGPGTTVHICGTIRGTAGQTLLTFQGSGTSGNPITLLFESGADLTAPYWGSGAVGAINVNGHSYITINGGSNGVIQNTEDGTGLTYQVSSTGIYLSNVSNITIENLSLINLCQVTSPSDTASCGSQNTGIFITGGASNVLVTRNTIHDVGIGMFYGATPGDSGDVYSYNTSYRVANSIQQYWSGGTGTVAGFSVIGNDMYCVIGGNCNWADTKCVRHLELMHVFINTSGDIYSGMVIADNYFHDLGTACASGLINLEASGGAITNFQIYNNVFVPQFNYAITSGTSGSEIVNNTIVGISNTSGLSGGSSSLKFENNIVNGATVTDAFLTGATGASVNFNSYFNWNVNNGWEIGAVFSGTLALWQSNSTGLCSGGCDLNAITSNPNLSASYVPNVGSPVIAAGTNLTSLNIAGLDQGAPQFFGVNEACGNGCTPRPSTGAWDMGAYPDPPVMGALPNPPTGLKAAVH